MMTGANSTIVKLDRMSVVQKGNLTSQSQKDLTTLRLLRKLLMKIQFLNILPKLPIDEKIQV
jgi:hypothetical protein